MSLGVSGFRCRHMIIMFHALTLHLHLFLTDPLCTAKGSTRQKNARSTTKTTASAAPKATTKTKAKGAVCIDS